MGLFSAPRESSLYSIFSDLAQCVSEGTETLSRTLSADAENNRARFAGKLEKIDADASALNRRITQRLATSLITPFEGDTLHEIAHALSTSLSAMERVANLAVRLNVESLPMRIMEALSIIERAGEHIVQGVWSLNEPSKLAHFYDDMRRLIRHADTHVRMVIEELLGAPALTINTLRVQEVVHGIERVLLALISVARSIDLLRIKDA